VAWFWVGIWVWFGVGIGVWNWVGKGVGKWVLMEVERRAWRLVGRKVVAVWVYY